MSELLLSDVFFLTYSHAFCEQASDGRRKCGVVAKAMVEKFNVVATTEAKARTPNGKSRIMEVNAELWENGDETATITDIQSQH